MNKRKACIFTVVESVPNWVEAGGCAVVSAEKGEGVANNRFGPEFGVLAPAELTPYTSAETSNRWAEDYPDTWTLTPGPKGVQQGLGDKQAGRGLTGPANWAEVGQSGRVPPATTDQYEGIQVLPRPTRANHEGSSSPAGVTGTLKGEEGTDEGALTQHPFWALLMAAGYEEI